MELHKLIELLEVILFELVDLPKEFNLFNPQAKVEHDRYRVVIKSPLIVNVFLLQSLVHKYRE